MDTTGVGPGKDNLDGWRAAARDYLRVHFKGEPELGDGVVFPKSPLHDDGAVAIFPFKAAKDEGRLESYYVVVGETEPNYYQAYDLDPEQAYSLHLGTRFMLVMGVAIVTWSGADGYDPAQNAREIAARVAPEGRIDDVQLTAMFAVDGELHAVMRVNLDGQAIYVMGRDAPWGFSTRTDLPAQVAYRLHIGHVLRAEPDPEQPRPSSNH